ncbi:hypothetical protein DF186_25690, partial [Enterococcus hirae]
GIYKTEEETDRRIRDWSVRLGAEMTIHLQRDLEKLRKDVLHLGALVNEITQLSVDFLESRSQGSLEEIIAVEEKIN